VNGPEQEMREYMLVTFPALLHPGKVAYQRT
jgi:hypothetical protein